MAGEIVLFHKQRFQAIERRIAGNRRPVNPAADDEEVI